MTEIEQKKVKNTIRRMAKALYFAFRGENDIFIGFYALMTAQMLICQYFEDCDDESEFKNIKRCLLKNLSEFTKAVYGTEFKGGKDVRH